MLRSLAASSFLIAASVAQVNFPPPPAPPSNPHTPAKELLGMTLFFEEQLSSTGTVACATCHDFARGGIDPRTATARNPGADGILFTSDDQHGSPGIAQVAQNGTLVPSPGRGFAPRITTRRAPTVINSGYHTHLTYDGSKLSLEQLVPAPLFNPVEMGHAGRTWSEVITRVTNARPLMLASLLPPRLQNFVVGRTYPALFQAVFGSAGVTQQRIVDAIACYLRTLNSDQSKWDLVQQQQETLTAQEALGLTLFNSPANGAVACKACHGDFENRVLLEGPIAGQMAQVGVFGYFGAWVPTRLVFHNTGVRPVQEDRGRQNVTNLAADAGRFRVASLRNVEQTAPYFHNGSAETLDDAVEFYNRGGDFHANQAPGTGPRNYTQDEIDALVAVMRTLTDPRVAAGVQPFDRPVLGSQTGAFVMAFGQGDTTATGTLVATSPWSARLGESWFRLGLTGATPGAPTFLMWDTAAIASPAPWNFHLALTPAFQVILTGTAQPSAGVAYGSAQVPIPLPNTPSLAGQTFFAQWLVLEASSSWPLAMSDGLIIQLH